MSRESKKGSRNFLLIPNSVATFCQEGIELLHLLILEIYDKYHSGILYFGPLCPLGLIRLPCFVSFQTENLNSDG